MTVKTFVQYNPTEQTLQVFLNFCRTKKDNRVCLYTIDRQMFWSRSFTVIQGEVLPQKIPLNTLWIAVSHGDASSWLHKLSRKSLLQHVFEWLEPEYVKKIMPLVNSRLMR